MLALEPGDYDVMVAVINAAEKNRARRDEALIRAYARSIGAETGNRVARAVNRMVRALAG